MENYNICSNTIAILANTNCNSVIHEDKRFIFCKKRPNFIIKKNCMMYGKTFEAAIEITKILTGFTYKPPIIVNDYQSLIYFPTKSIRCKDNEWICLNRIKNYYENKRNNRTIIEFDNGKLLEFNISYHTMNKQILRASYLLSKINSFELD